MTLSIRKAKASEISDLHQILVNCGDYLQARFNLCYWFPPYPLRRMIEDINKMDIYAVQLQAEVIGTFTIETTIPPGYLKYGNINWQNQDLRAFYIHRLAVLPAYQGKGIGTCCLQEIEKIAINCNYSAIRLDAVKINQKLLNFYQKSGYRQVGEFIFKPDDKYDDAFVFEKLLQ